MTPESLFSGGITTERSPATEDYSRMFVSPKPLQPPEQLKDSKDQVLIKQDWKRRDLLTHSWRLPPEIREEPETGPCSLEEQSWSNSE